MPYEREPTKSLLPIVNNGTLRKVIAEFSAQPGLLDATFRRIGDLAVQPTLGLQTLNRIDLVARDDQERINMRDIVATVYCSLETQARADYNKAQMGVPLSETLPA